MDGRHNMRHNCESGPLKDHSRKGFNLAKWIKKRKVSVNLVYTTHEYAITIKDQFFYL
jgi:hypothetical protein